MIIKWAGSKKWLHKKHPYLFNHKFNSYFEPFLGGGSIFFLLRPKNACISDINEHLINCFKALKEDPKSLYLDVKNLSIVILRKHIIYEEMNSTDLPSLNYFFI